MKIPLDTTFDNKDPYRILGVAPSSSPAAIRKAYLELAKRNHPNLFATDPEKYRTSTAFMQDINAAYGLLRDPAQREFWDRRHPRPAVPTRAPRREPAQSVYYDPEQVHLVIQKYNQFVSSLRTAEERQTAVRNVRAFQTSREGSAFIKKLVASHYQRVIDLLNLGRHISVYDDGLVELMYLYAGALEVDPSPVFITYAYVVFRGNRGKAPARPCPAGGPVPGAKPAPELRLRGPGGTKRRKPGRGIVTLVRDWLRPQRNTQRR